MTMADTTVRMDEAEQRFARWPGLLRLALGFVVGFVAVLWDQAVAYMATPWACSVSGRWTVHVVHLLFLVIAILVGAIAWRDWRATGSGVRDDEATVVGRSRFLALAGMAASVYSALVILAMWIAVLFLGPCQSA